MKDLKKNFYTLIHDFLKVKLCTYGFKTIKMIDFTKVYTWSRGKQMIWTKTSECRFAKAETKNNNLEISTVRNLKKLM